VLSVTVEGDKHASQVTRGSIINKGDAIIKGGTQGIVAGHDGGEDQSALMGLTTAIYSYKNSHSHMMKSHDWLTQTHSTGMMCATRRGSENTGPRLLNCGSLGTRTQIRTRHMLDTLGVQTMSDSNVPSGQKLGLLKMYP